MPIKPVPGSWLFVFAVLEMSERFRQVSFPPQYMPVGGLSSGLNVLLAETVRIMRR